MRHKMIKNILSGILLTALAIMIAGTVSAKSLYVIASWDSNPNPINAYDIQGGTLVYQSTGYVPSHGAGAMGLALDTDSKRLFVTYEASNIIEMIDAETFVVLGSQTAVGASNLAGTRSGSTEWTGLCRGQRNSQPLCLRRSDVFASIYSHFT